MNCQRQVGAHSGGPETCFTPPLPNPPFTGGKAEAHAEEPALPGAASR